MTEPVTLTFELTPDDINNLLYPRRGRGYLNIGIFVVLGAVCVAIPRLAHIGILLLGLGIVGVLVMFKMPRIRRDQVSRLSGATKVEFSERGVVYSGASIAERIEWSRVTSLSDRPNRWVILTQPSNVLYLVPKSAVPAEHAEQFVSQLMDWSGKAYKFRHR